MIADTLGLSELISDSPSELAAVLGHELGHVFQQRRGRRIFDSTNAEFDADVWGLFLALYGGYDPYGAAGAMAKLAMVTGTAGLIQQFEQQLAPDAHKSFNTRLELLFDGLVNACKAVPEPCRSYKGLFHPDFPDSAPLSIPRPVSANN